MKWLISPLLAALMLLPTGSKSAFNKFQLGYTPNPQIFYNIVTDGGAACNGDKQTVNRVATTSGTGNKNLNVTVNTFVSGDVGKQLNFDYIDAAITKRYYGKIASFTDAQNVVLDTNVPAAAIRTSQATDIYFGTADQVAFQTFNTWARTNQGSNQVVLTIPNGASCWFGTNLTIYTGGNHFASGINNLIVEGTGATIDSLGGSSFWLGGPGVCQRGLTDPNGCSARIQTAMASTSTVTLTAESASAGYISRFKVGQWIMLGALDIQGLFNAPYGYPPNMNYFEWRQIVSCNAAPTTCTGTTITLDRPLTNSYLSTFANYNSGNAFEVDQGGPATIWTVGNTIGGSENVWNASVEYRGLTISQEGQTYGPVRNLTYRGVTFTGAHGGIPTQNETFSAINTDYGVTTMETDKLVGTMLMDGVTINTINFQSSSTDLFVMRNSTVTNSIFGGGRSTDISDTTLTGNWAPGLIAYGDTAGYTKCTRCTIGTLQFVRGFSTGGGSNNFYPMTSGLITMPNAAAQGSGPGQRPFVPGTRIFYDVPSRAISGMLNTVTVTGDSWPAVDNQTATTNVTTTNGSNSMTVSTAPFTGADVGKTIIVPGAESGGAQLLKTWITGVSGAGPQTITLGTNATRSQTAISQSLQWGTSNTYIQTSAAGSYPDVSAFTASFIGITVAGSPSFTCDTCNIGNTSSDAWGASVQAGATPGAPLGSFIKRTFSPSAGNTNLGRMPGFGKFTKLTINVTQAFAGSGTATMTPTGQFQLATINQASSTWTSFNLFPTINLKQAGKREIVVGGVTCDGVAGPCSGDTISAPSGSSGGYPPNQIWLSGNESSIGITPWSQGTYAGMTTQPIVTVTLETDQSP